MIRCLVGCVIGSLVDWLVGRVDWLIGWLIWLNGVLIGFLIVERWSFYWLSRWWIDALKGGYVEFCLVGMLFLVVWFIG